ncbi:hypothetical protein ACB092_08G055300 [Castanea dentata]
MGKHLEDNISGFQLEESHPSCMWGIVHILDYHHWHNVKKILPHKKHRGRQTRSKKCPRKILNTRDIEVQGFIASEAEPFPIEQHGTKISPTTNNKRSGKAHIKELFAKEMSKEDNHRYRNLSFAARAWLRRIFPIHHLEPSDNSLDEIHTDGKNTIGLLPQSADISATRFQYSSPPKTPEELVTCNKKFTERSTLNDVDYLGHKQSAVRHAHFPEKYDERMQTSANQKPMESNQPSRDISNNQFNEYFDVLEILKVNQESFIKILQEPNIGMKHLSLQTSNTKARLTKSGSFPVANPSSTKNIRPSTLKHKQNESRYFPRGEKFLAASLESQSGASKSQKEYQLQSILFMADNNSAVSAIRQETDLSSLESSQGLSNQGWNQRVINRFKEIKQKIMHALKENRNESNHTFMEALDESVPPGCQISSDGKQMSKSSEISTHQDGIDNPRSYEANGPDYDPSRGRLDRMQRTSSLNESLNRYTELFERSFGREAKWHHSKSLKLTNEVKVPSSGHPPKSFIRRLSLPDLDSLCTFLNEASGNAQTLVMPGRTTADCSTMAESKNHSEPKSVSTSLEAHTSKPTHDAAESEFLKDVIGVSDSSWNIKSSADLIAGKNYEGINEIDDPRESAIEESSLHQDQKIGLTMNLRTELAHPCAELREPGPGLNPRSTQTDETFTSVDQKIRPITDSSPTFCSSVNPEDTENANNNVDNHFLHIDLDKMDEADFNYVRDVLELSGFINNECLGEWYSLDQPLDPSLFKELENCLHPELESYGENVSGNCDHQLLYDLINDTLLEIYERSFTYFPRSFSFNCHIHPMPKGNYLLEEVWAKVSSYLILRPELDQSLNDVVARDMAKGDGWMNLQFDNECVALELEDLIFDELLEEFMCS